MDTIHISESEAIRDFPALIARARAGAEIVIDGDAPSVRLSVIRGPGRLLSECIASAKARGSKITLDGDFGRDLEAVIAVHREPLDIPNWDE